MLFYVPYVFAANVEVVGRVGSNAIDSKGSSVIFKDATTKQVVGQTTVDPSGVYSISVPKGTYDIVIAAPIQSHLPTITKTNQTISSNGEVNIALPNPAANQSTNKNNAFLLLIGVIAVIASVGYFIKW